MAPRQARWITSRPRAEGRRFGRAQVGLLVAAIGAGVCLLVAFLFILILRESKWSDLKTPMNLAAAAELLVYLGHVAMVALPAVAVQTAYSQVARRVR
jgi:hypothetical protein